VSLSLKFVSKTPEADLKGGFSLPWLPELRVKSKTGLY
jgi:hypothetical protein